MSSQVSDEIEVELKYFRMIEKEIPNGALSLSFYRPREGPGIHEREKIDNNRGDSRGAAPPKAG
jgi:hypothetical protein